MTRTVRKTTLHTALILSTALGLSACNTLDRLATIGNPPVLSTIANPNKVRGYKPVSMPMPDPVRVTRRPNSLWQEGSRAFFKDQRASDIGDIITVVVELEDEAQLDVRTRHDRTKTDDFGVTGLFGLENLIPKVLPGAETGTDLFNLNSSMANDGRGRVDRTETVNLRVAAVISQKLPNGNLVVFGRQEIRVNYEVREVVVGGIIRPEDIATTNTIGYDQMAEARIAYGGRGQLSDLQQMRYGSQVMEVLMPF
ncbi:MAG: flagellar basal body L-ring protein FlgH [Alphaproteobacteria bacterium]|nr:flagellar basal body L-ring protein FlgH [Alphaproteobacteria bacterium]